nr:IS3 family transposase [Pseudonocardia parietis]
MPSTRRCGSPSAWSTPVSRPRPGPQATVTTALAENLWSTLKVELVYWPGTTFATRAEAEHALLRYIDGWYNPRRIQAGLGGLSPDEYEDAYHRAQRDDHR